MTAATHFIDARVSRHIGTYSDAVAIPAGVCTMKSSARRRCLMRLAGKICDAECTAGALRSRPRVAAALTALSVARLVA
ncbi:hypothetical protein SAMN05216276_108924 [Streptosporangium subroseum]|uniref:Uncharacterized protein n=1 Tax=Streptosporangium subroseum TaxID=106412 RepID=A0A239P6N9_9ACTN|nr:hypothetical protein SAMN05216276_108924 [Streptosporangium subroseum]